MKKIQLLYVHGGDTFRSQADFEASLKDKEVCLEKLDLWPNTFLDTALSDSFQIIRPRFPLSDNAFYSHWEIVFEKYLDVLDDDIVLVGWSLGAVFLAKFLSEHRVDKRIKSLCLVAPPFDDSLSGERLCNGFELGSDLFLLQENCSSIHLFFSRSDEVVPIVHADLYMEKIPEASLHVYDDKNGHFIVEEFPELVSVVKDAVKKL